MADEKEDISDLATPTPAADISDLAAPTQSAPPSMMEEPPGSSIGAFNEGLLNELFASAQGSSPMTRSLTGQANYLPLGTLITSETDFAPANTMYEVEPGKYETFDPSQHVVFSEGGRLNVYQRNPQMEEGRLLRLGRLLGIGGLTPNRAALAVRPSASALEAGVEALEASGVTPNLPMASQGTGAARTAAITRSVPFAGEPIERGVRRARTETEQATADVVEQYGRGAGAEEAGESLRTAGAEWLKRWRTEGAKLDADLMKSFKDAGVDDVELNNFAKALDSPFEEFDNPALAKQFSDEWLEGWREIMKETNGRVSLNDLKGLRRRLGKMLEQPMIVSDQDRAQVQALYRSLASDLEAAARKGGGQELVDKVAERNKYWREGFDTIERSMKRVIDERINAEAIFERVMASSKGKGGRANMRFLRDVRNSVGPEAWDELASSVLVRMGTAPGAQQSAESMFNPLTFLTNYNNMSVDARKLLFSGREQAARNLKNLTDNVMPALQRVEEVANKSRSGEVVTGGGLGALAAMGIYTGDLMQILGAVGTAAGANVVSRALMNPRFTRWLARTSTAAKKLDAAGVDMQQFWTTQLPRLRTIVAANPELQPMLEGFEQRTESR